MPKLVVNKKLSLEDLERATSPRTGLVFESLSESTGSKPNTRSWEFTWTKGPFKSYRRTVSATPTSADKTPSTSADRTAPTSADKTISTSADRTFLVTQTVEYKYSYVWWSALFIPTVRRALGRIDYDSRTRPPWWLPPEALGPRQVNVLAQIAIAATIIGYLVSLITQTVTYVARDFHASNGAIGNTLSIVRLDAILSAVVMLMADKRGRKPILIYSIALGCAISALGSFAQSMYWLGINQTIASSFFTTALILATVYLAEEMPAGSRAFALGVITVSGALGAAIPVMLLKVAAAGNNGWRVLFALSIAGLAFIPSLSRSLPETDRHLKAVSRPKARARLSQYKGRIVLVVLINLLTNAFSNPASLFLNQFLRTERHYAPSAISLFVLVTYFPGVIGLVVGGRLADIFGRRVVGSVALVAGSGITVLSYFAFGWKMWLLRIVGIAIGTAVIPTLNVYSPELFPTSLRGKANGFLNVAVRAGTVTGLQVVGRFSSALGGIGGAMAVLSVAPIILAVLLIFVYPETARMQLEAINPEDGED